MFRERDGEREYLLVRPSNGRDEWLLPKGHIEPGEVARQAAEREVREECAVQARIVTPLGRTEFAAPRGVARVEWFLMRFEREVEPLEQRERGWFGLDAALARASFEEVRTLLRSADAKLVRGGES